MLQRFKDLPWWRRCLLGGALGAALALSTACNPIPFHAGAQAHTVAAPPKVQQMTVGDVHLRIGWVFGTDKARTHGLMGTTLPASTGAVFTWLGASTSTSFWMMDTPEALSLLWISGGRAIGHVEMVRCALSCPTYKPPGSYDTAVEAPAGTFAHVKAGTAVSFS